MSSPHMFLAVGAIAPPHMQQAPMVLAVTVAQFRSVSMPVGFRRHLVGKTLKNAGYCNSA